MNGNNRLTGGLSARCADCDEEYLTTAPAAADEGLCARCQKADDQQYQNDPAPYVDSEPSPWSRAGMRERLGVTGDVDE